MRSQNNPQQHPCQEGSEERRGFAGGAARLRAVSEEDVPWHGQGRRLLGAEIWEGGDLVRGWHVCRTKSARRIFLSYEISHEKSIKNNHENSVLDNVVKLLLMFFLKQLNVLNFKARFKFKKIAIVHQSHNNFVKTGQKIEKITGKICGQLRSIPGTN